MNKAELIEACDALANETQDPFRLGENDYAAPGAYLDNLKRKLEKSDATEVTLAELVAWGNGREQTALYDALRAWFHEGSIEAASIEPTLTIGEDEIRVFNGDLRVNGDVEKCGSLLVVGNLTVSGMLRSLGDDATSGALYVTGNVDARACHLMGPMMIVGDLSAARVIYTAHFDDGGALWGGGELKTPVYAACGDRNDLVGKLGAKKLTGRLLHETFPEYFDEDGAETDLVGFFERCCKSGP